MKHLSKFVSICCLLGFTTLMGCGKAETKMVSVTGKVTIKGKNISSTGYALTFTPSEGKAVSVDLEEDGTFSGEVPEGKCEVSLISTNMSGHDEKKTDDAGSGEDEIMYESLNDIDIAADGELTFDFKIENQ